MSDELVTVDVEILHQTSEAYKVSDGDLEAWIPISKVENEDPTEDGYIEIPEWLALQEGLI